MVAGSAAVIPHDWALVPLPRSGRSIVPFPLWRGGRGAADARGLWRALGPRRHDCIIERSQDGAGAIEKHPTRRQQRHPFGRALKQRRSDFLFQRANLPTERRLGHMQSQGSPAHVAFFGDSDEIADLRQAHDPDRADRASAGQAQGRRMRQIQTVLDHRCPPQAPYRHGH